MEGKGICPFIFAAEQVRLAIERGIENEKRADVATREVMCIGEDCAVYNEGKEGCGLSGPQTIDIRKI